ncbi:unnamed protein product [Auanema sp. JU1783]|nr:unnamed protein product [Auanema sp. JU1783]
MNILLYLLALSSLSQCLAELYLNELTASNQHVAADALPPHTRTKRYVVRKKKWNKNLLTWKLDPINIGEADTYIVRNTLHRAFNEWQGVSSVTFAEKTEGKTDLTVSFQKNKHDDPYPFDGRDGVVAHAFYPRDGRLHFDADEDWTLNSDSGVNLFQTAVHEIGHLLGLEHSTDPRAVMYASKKPFTAEFSLSDDDVRAIRKLFPVKGESSEVDSKSDNVLYPVVVENLEKKSSTAKAEIKGTVAETAIYSPSFDDSMLFPFTFGTLDTNPNDRKFVI